MVNSIWQNIIEVLEDYIFLMCINIYITKNHNSLYEAVNTVIIKSREFFQELYYMTIWQIFRIIYNNTNENFAEFYSSKYLINNYNINIYRHQTFKKLIS